MIAAMTDIDGEFSTRTETRTVVHLYRNGVIVRTTDGKPAEYATVAEATHVARNWHVYGSRPLMDLSDAELTEKYGHFSWLERGRRALSR